MDVHEVASKTFVGRTLAGMPGRWVFECREDAGQALARVVARRHRGADAIVLAIPRGGVPVGMPVAMALSAPLDVIVPRKIPIPWDPEAGFGAVTADGTVVLNDELMPYVNLTSEDIDRQVAAVRAEIRRRTDVYRDGRPPPDVEGKLVLLTDDGLATGLTMVAAVRSLRGSHARRIVVAVPAAPRGSVERVANEADEIICLLEQAETPFAVASYYHYFPELTDAQVIRALKQVRYAGI